jgi:hypothetical protein
VGDWVGLMGASGTRSGRHREIPTMGVCTLGLVGVEQGGGDDAAPGDVGRDKLPSAI